MNTPDHGLNNLIKERESLARQLYLVDEKINNYLWERVDHKRRTQTPIIPGAVIPGVTPGTHVERGPVSE